MKISGAVITFNEEENLDRCLNSLKDVCDEIVIIDSFSTDNTQEIAVRYGGTFIQNEFSGFVEQKNFAMEACTHDWVLSLDADEELSDELKKSIQEVKKNGNAEGYIISRLNNYCGKFIHHGAWYPDAKIRFWNRQKGRWQGDKVHEVVEMQKGSSKERLKGDILHYSYKNEQEHRERIVKYAMLSAEELAKKKKPFPLLNMFFNPGFKFVKEYFFRGGWQDGAAGFKIAYLNGYATFLKYHFSRKIRKEQKLVK